MKGRERSLKGPGFDCTAAGLVRCYCLNGLSILNKASRDNAPVKQAVKRETGGLQHERR
ncbi:hypothetical protein PSAB6_150083 [Paraburkholderia sabiae]|nr:hypothetical protein PSAB6_150083 [Paraburkholderia sabiae]